MTATYTVIDDGTGTVLRTGASIDEVSPIQAHEAVICVQAPPPPPPPPAAVTAMSLGSFMDRLGEERELMINELRIDLTVPGPIRAKIETLYAKLNRRTKVDVAVLETQNGVASLAQLLVYAKSMLSRAEGLDASEVPAFIAMMLALPSVAEQA